MAKEICYKLPLSACPRCGSLRYAVIDMNASLYITDGEREVLNIYV